MIRHIHRFEEDRQHPQIAITISFCFKASGFLGGGGGGFFLMVPAVPLDAAAEEAAEPPMTGGGGL
jgi:hypothetical protein